MSIVHVADDNRREFSLPDEAATLALAAALAQVLSPPAVIYLEGDLAAGKTTLVRGLLRKLGTSGAVKSPTYGLLELHAISGLCLYHFDFYRFKIPEEFLDAGLDEYFAQDAICLVEWPDRAQPYLPAADLRVQLEHAGNARRACIAANSERGRQWLRDMPVSPDATSSVVAAPS